MPHESFGTLISCEFQGTFIVPSHKIPNFEFESTIKTNLTKLNLIKVKPNRNKLRKLFEYLNKIFSYLLAEKQHWKHYGHAP